MVLEVRSWAGGTVVTIVTIISVINTIVKSDSLCQEWESAVARGQPILAELVGYGMSGAKRICSSLPVAPCLLLPAV